MQELPVSIEISYYPLEEGFKPIIDRFIANLEGHYGIKVVVNTMSTQVFGAYDIAMNAVSDAMKKSMSEGQKSVFSLKVINSNLDPETDPHGWNHS